MKNTSKQKKEDCNCQYEQGHSFACPKCKFPTEFSAELLMVKCNQCGYMGDKDEFSSELLLNENT